MRGGSGCHGREAAPSFQRTLSRTDSSLLLPPDLAVLRETGEAEKEV